ncbi:MAG: DEAD/DEAH box helicase, partial [Acidithiobacillus sp.]|nr:DEAD/DEAH box helicase [Acidithiobacillus sp.]
KFAKQDGLQFQTLIADEAHYLKSGKAQRTKAVQMLASKIDQKILLSGTPITRAPVDLYSQIEILGKTPRFGSYKEFTSRYCDGHYEEFRNVLQPVWVAKGATNVRELAERMKKELGYLRREKTLVAKELPEKTRQVLSVALAAVDYRNLRKIAAKGDPEIPGSILAAMQEQLGYIGKAKIEPAKEWVADFVEENPERKLIVFAQHIEVQKALAESLKEHGIVTIFGEHSATQRGEAVDRFQTDPRARIAVCSLGAASVGVTLTAASDVLMVEQDWTPATLLQAEDRAHRIGQSNAVNVTYLVAEDTLDSERMLVIQEKFNVANALNQSVQAEFVQKMERALKRSKSVSLSSI